VVIAPPVGAYLMHHHLLTKKATALRLFVTAVILLLLPVSLSADTYIAIVQGLAGEEYYQRVFTEQTEATEKAAQSIVKDTGDVIKVFRENRTLKQDLLSWLDTIAVNISKQDRVLFFYNGHGSYSGQVYKFNLPGEDLTGEEIKTAFDKLNAELKLILNTGSSSGALLSVFADDDKTVVITATKSGGQRNATRFGQFIMAALTDDSADVDKNQQISAKEAFDYAQQQTNNFYQEEGLIATENSVIQGEHSNLLIVSSLADQSNINSNPQLAALYQERDEFDLAIQRLRIQRVGMSDKVYRNEFQSLMIELSLLQEKIDKLEGAE
jgi:hypothetical protein